MVDSTETEWVVGLAERFILETNAFLARHWDEEKVWWPLKASADDRALPHVAGTAGTRTISSTDAEELVSRLIQSCGIIDTREGFAGYRRCAILLVVDAEQGQPQCRQLVDVA